MNRSTLPHRLNRITQLTGANLDDFMTRLYLMMGCYILDHI
ncbi:helix-turn-helix domain-containing protein [Clostridium sp. HCS.1]